MSNHNEAFHKLHPDVANTIEQPCHKYTRLSDEGDVLEQWTEDEDGELQDTSTKAILEQEIRRQAAEIARLEARQAAKEAKGD